MFFFWYKPEERRAIINELRKIGRADLIDKLYGKYKAWVLNSPQIIQIWSVVKLFFNVLFTFHRVLTKHRNRYMCSKLQILIFIPPKLN